MKITDRPEGWPGLDRREAPAGATGKRSLPVPAPATAAGGSAAPPAPAILSAIHPRPWLAAGTLCRREWVRFIRQPNRVFGAIGQPLIFWVLFGAGLDQERGVAYREYFFPGALVLILLFTAIFATISIIEDRREGFLQSVLVAPIPRWSMVLGKIMGGTLIAVAQGALFVLLGYTVGFQLGPLALAAVIGWMFLVALGLTALGFVLAWRMDSTQGFHAVMSVLLMPMWLLSGAFFAAKSNWLGYVIAANPLTYGVAGLRHLLYWGAGPNAEAVRDLPSFWVCLAVTLMFCAVMFAVAWRISARRTTGDLL